MEKSILDILARPQTGPRKTQQKTPPDTGLPTMGESIHRDYVGKRKHTKGLLIPDAVRDSLQSRPPQMFFFDTPTRRDFHKHELEDFHSEFPNLSDTISWLRDKRKQDDRDLFVSESLYRNWKNHPYPITKYLAWRLAWNLDNTIGDWDSLDNNDYTRSLYTVLDTYMNEHPKTDVIIIFDSKYEKEKDIEEVNYFLGVLCHLCAWMPKYDSRLKVIVIFNDRNKLWDKFFSYTEYPGTAFAKDLCTAHKFNGEGWLQVWPEKNEANMAKKRVKKEAQ
ncbi:uncharacterized protein TRUGW13939_06484 [Talaromyces rugulosus]|uniref:Uncharacterized protein n=1 Tax=Talaromyces rugulosus TaxID=121627 RepID=A0A7H8QZ28_TALRU|nr:uncharacterized protein TRUGW13939_06484 [Talaromyces rugulosus]QKX59350.1 hypothetical protein TRUGW13939_06484 [Talaromyces rugulosus]